MFKAHLATYISHLATFDALPVTVRGHLVMFKGFPVTDIVTFRWCRECPEVKGHTQRQQAGRVVNIICMFT